MTLLPVCPELHAALTAVQSAAQLCQTVRRDRQATALRKPDQSPVTVADYGAQALIAAHLGETFPTDPLVGEEDASLLAADVLAQITDYVQLQRSQVSPETVAAWIQRGKGQPGDRFWTLDPIDGTKGYVRGDQYAIALALIVEGQVEVAAIAAPALDGPDGALFAAVRGQGAWQIQGDRVIALQVSDRQATAALRLESVEREHGHPAWQDAIATRAGLVTPARAVDSLVKYALIARGEADLYLRLVNPESDRRENIWDHAAGVLLLQEAGGCVSDQTGRSLDFGAGSKLFNNQGIAASNAACHAAVLAALRAQTPLLELV
ncbi:inositol monophosphatase family protein [Synechococcus elongatus]|uniref:inositol monophosphatase family protein n=1 Tax=Synechococcus elongatus TaxID=32046 RepID=UPI0030D003C7